MKKENLKLILTKEGDFLGVKCNFYKDEADNVYMTREQIGEALKYSNPQKAIDNLHNRNVKRLDKFSVTLKMRATDNKEYNTKFYTEKGIYDICRFSRQSVADEFYDWVYDQLELIRKTAGVVQEGREMEFLDNYFPTLTEETKLSMVKDLQSSIKEQQNKIKELEPKADNWQAYVDTKGNMTIAKFAKAINVKGFGRNKMFDLLRNKKILRSNNEPYQQYIDREYFTVKFGSKNGFAISQTFITPKGLEWIRLKLKEWEIA